MTLFRVDFRFPPCYNQQAKGEKGQTFLSNESIANVSFIQTMSGNCFANVAFFVRDKQKAARSTILAVEFGARLTGRSASGEKVHNQ